MRDSDMASSEEDEAPVIFLMATNGEGEPTDNAMAFYKYFEDGHCSNLKAVKFAVFALGNRQYEHFCAMGKWADATCEREDIMWSPLERACAGSNAADRHRYRCRYRSRSRAQQISPPSAPRALNALWPSGFTAVATCLLASALWRFLKTRGACILRSSFASTSRLLLVSLVVGSAIRSILASLFKAARVQVCFAPEHLFCAHVPALRTRSPGRPPVTTLAPHL